MEEQSAGPRKRTPLTRDRVIAGALALADTGGLASLTIRSLAQSLGVKPMTVYGHVANKEQILDELIDAVFAEIEMPDAQGHWRDGVRQRARSARAALVRHPWAIGLMESRTTPGPATLQHHNAMLGMLGSAGFSLTMTATAYAMLDSYVYGFALQEAGLPFSSPETAHDMAESILRIVDVEQYPHLHDFTVRHVLQPGYDFAAEFDLGLDILLDALTGSLSEGSVKVRSNRSPVIHRSGMAGLGPAADPE